MFGVQSYAKDSGEPEFRSAFEPAKDSGLERESQQKEMLPSDHLSSCDGVLVLRSQTFCSSRVQLEDLSSVLIMQSEAVAFTRSLQAWQYKVSSTVWNTGGRVGCITEIWAFSDRFETPSGGGGPGYTGESRQRHNHLLFDQTLCHLCFTVNTFVLKASLSSSRGKQNRCCRKNISSESQNFSCYMKV